MTTKVLEAELRIIGVDNTGRVFDNVAGKFDKLQGALNAGGSAAAKFGGAGVAAMNNVATAADRVDGILSQITKTLASGYILHKIVQLGRESEVAFAKLDDIRRMQAAAAGTAETPPALLEQQERLGRGATRFSDLEIAKAQLAVEQSGVALERVAPIIDQAKDFAVAMDATDLAQVAKHLVETGEALKQVGQASPAALQHLTDLETKLHLISGMKEEFIAGAMAQGGVAATAVGLSPASIMAMIKLMSSTGVEGDAAGTTIRLLTTKLAAPGQQGIEALASMGIDYRKFVTEGGLSPESFQAFMKRQGLKIKEIQPGSWAKIFADPKVMGNEEEFTKVVVAAAYGRLRDKKGKIKSSAIKTLTEDVQKYYAENVSKVDTEGLVEAMVAAHPTLEQLTALFGTLRAARSLPFLRDQVEYEQLKKQFENVPEGSPRKSRKSRKRGLAAPTAG